MIHAHNRIPLLAIIAGSIVFFSGRLQACESTKNNELDEKLAYFGANQEDLKRAQTIQPEQTIAQLTKAPLTFSHILTLIELKRIEEELGYQSEEQETQPAYQDPEENKKGYFDENYGYCTYSQEELKHKNT